MPASNTGQSIPSCLFDAGGEPLDRVGGRRYLSRLPKYYAIDGGQSADVVTLHARRWIENRNLIVHCVHGVVDLPDGLGSKKRRA